MFTRWRPRGLGGRAVGLGRERGALGCQGAGKPAVLCRQVRPQVCIQVRPRLCDTTCGYRCALAGVGLCSEPLSHHSQLIYSAAPGKR